MKNIFLLCFCFLTVISYAQKRNPGNKATFLADISWKDAETLLKKEATVVLPPGAESKIHGLHLPISTEIDISVSHFFGEYFPINTVAF